MPAASALGLDGGEKFEIILQRRDRRHEDAENAVARLDGQRRAHRAFDRLLLDALLPRGAAAGARHSLLEMLRDFLAVRQGPRSSSGS